MNDEENSFDRSNGESHDASELHSFGGMKDESPEETDKTENEELEDAIEELESSEVEDSMPEEKIEEPKEELKEDIPAEEPEEKPEFKLDEPIEELKKEEPTMTIDSVKEPKAKKECKGGAGWKVATILFALLAIAGCGGLCYLFFVDGTTNILGRTITSSQTKPITPNKPAEKPEEPAKPSADDIDLDSLESLVVSSPEESFVVRASGLTKDNKYYFAMINTNVEGMDGAWYAGTWYRKAEKDSEWTELVGYNDSTLIAPACKDLTLEQRNFIKNYQYLVGSDAKTGVTERDLTCVEEDASY